MQKLKDDIFSPVVFGFIRMFDNYSQKGRVIFIRNHESEATAVITPTTQDGELCAIIVYGIVPELMPHRAFRRDKYFKSAGKKIIKCPFCGEKLTSVEITAKLKLMSYPKKNRHKVNWNKSMQCCNCSNIVGLIYLAA